MCCTTVGGKRTLLHRRQLPGWVGRTGITHVQRSADGYGSAFPRAADELARWSTHTSTVGAKQGMPARCKRDETRREARKDQACFGDEQGVPRMALFGRRTDHGDAQENPRRATENSKRPPCGDVAPWPVLRRACVSIFFSFVLGLFRARACDTRPDVTIRAAIAPTGQGRMGGRGRMETGGEAAEGRPLRCEMALGSRVSGARWARLGEMRFDRLASVSAEVRLACLACLSVLQPCGRAGAGWCRRRAGFGGRQRAGCVRGPAARAALTRAAGLIDGLIPGGLAVIDAVPGERQRLGRPRCGQACRAARRGLGAGWQSSRAEEMMRSRAWPR